LPVGRSPSGSAGDVIGTQYNLLAGLGPRECSSNPQAEPRETFIAFHAPVPGNRETGKPLSSEDFPFVNPSLPHSCCVDTFDRRHGLPRSKS